MVVGLAPENHGVLERNPRKRHALQVSDRLGVDGACFGIVYVVKLVVTGANMVRMIINLMVIVNLN